MISAVCPARGMRSARWQAGGYTCYAAADTNRVRSLICKRVHQTTRNAYVTSDYLSNCSAFRLYLSRSLSLARALSFSRCQHTHSLSLLMKAYARTPALERVAAILQQHAKTEGREPRVSQHVQHRHQHNAQCATHPT